MPARLPLDMIENGLRHFKANAELLQASGHVRRISWVTHGWDGGILRLLVGHPRIQAPLNLGPASGMALAISREDELPADHMDAGDQFLALARQWHNMDPPIFGPARGQSPSAAIITQLVSAHSADLAAPLSGQEQEAQRWPKWFAQITRCAPQPFDLTVGQDALSRRASSRLPYAGGTD